MVQSDYIRLVPGAETAVLFIHGIVGSPAHFIQLIPLVQLVPKSFSVYNMLLDGHGGTAKDFGKSSMKKWELQVGEVFDMLAGTHSQIVVVGHSMGTLFAVDLAQKHPEAVKQLFLLAVPLRPKLGIDAIGGSLRLVWGKLREEIPSEMALAVACGAEPTRKVWHYLGWIPRFAELLDLCGKTAKGIDKVKVSCVAFQSGRDELVRRSSEQILARNSGITVVILQDSTHFYYTAEDRKLVCSSFREIMDGLKTQD